MQLERDAGNVGRSDDYTYRQWPAKCGSCFHCPWLQVCAEGAERPLRKNTTLPKAKRIVLKKGSFVYRQGENMSFLYVVRSGNVLIDYHFTEGVRQVIGFKFVSDMIGLDGFADSFYRTSAVSLSALTLCQIPVTSSADLFDNYTNKNLLTSVLRASSGQVRDLYVSLSLVGRHQAPTRIASLLVDVSENLGKRGFRRDEFVLPMSRIEIADYISSTPETVSRIFSTFRKENLISTEGRSVKILSQSRLRQRSCRYNGSTDIS